MLVKSRSKKNIVVLLTACINPGETCLVERKNPAQRLADYKKALLFWLKCQSLQNIVFCENSGADLAELRELVRTNNTYGKTIEFLSFYGQPPLPSLGKGYGEMRIISYALEHSTAVRDADFVLKVTGRLIINNVQKIIDGASRITDVHVLCDLSHSLSFADSRVFLATPSFLSGYLVPFLDLINDSAGIYFEHVLARAAHRAMADGLSWTIFPCARDFYGMRELRIKKSLVHF